MAAHLLALAVGLILLLDGLFLLLTVFVTAAREDSYAVVIVTVGFILGLAGIYLIRL